MAKCFYCSKSKDEELLPTLCECENLYIHLSCVKGYNSMICYRCDKKFQGKMNKTIKYRNIILAIILFSTLIYINVGFYLIDKYYTKPNEIKSNQKPIICTTNNITYTLINANYINNTFIEEFEVQLAYNEKRQNIAYLFESYRCNTGKCPDELTILCWNYKDYYGIKKESINNKFNFTPYFVWFLFAGFFLIIPPFLALAINEFCQ